MSSQREINEYLKGLKNGERCLDGFVNASVGYLRFVAYRYLVDKSFVDDVVSSAFFKIFDNIQTFDENQNGMSWIYKITQNEAYAINNRERKHAHVSLDEIMDEVACTVDHSEHSRFLEAFNKALDKLPEQDRKIVEMRYLQGLTYPVIGKALGMYVGTVYKRYNAALKIIWKDISK